MNETIEKIFKKTKSLAGEAYKGANILAEKGKKKVDLISLESDMSKAQRQLGALVYTLKKTGEENEELLNQYIERVEILEKQINELKGTDAKNAKVVCANCGAQASQGAMFCSGCGKSLQ